MKSTCVVFSLALLFSCSVTRPCWSQSPSGVSQPVLADDAKLRQVGDRFQFTEGPAADQEGNVYFTDQPNDRIVRYDFQSNELTDWLSPCGRSNGLAFVKPNRLIACADDNNQLWEIDIQTKQHRILAKGFEERRFSGPNDCWVDRDGSIYFTDPLYKRPYWKHRLPDDHPRAVFRLDPQGNLSIVADNLRQPNGIIGDAENRRLYVADIGDSKTYQFEIDPDGSLKNRTLFCAMGSDGMTIDQQRNIYLTGKAGVTVFDQAGEKIETISVPKGWTANVTFAGPKKDHLFITAGDSVFVIQTLARGLD